MGFSSSPERGVVLIVLVLSVLLTAVLAGSTPALARRLLQSPVQTPAPTETFTPAPPAQPTPVPPTPAPPTEAPAVAPTLPPAETPAPTPLPTPLPEEAQGARPAGGFDWARFMDVLILIFSYLWLICGILVVLAIITVVIVLTIRSRRRAASAQEPPAPEEPTRGE